MCFIIEKEQPQVNMWIMGWEDKVYISRKREREREVQAKAGVR